MAQLWFHSVALGLPPSLLAVERYQLAPSMWNLRLSCKEPILPPFSLRWAAESAAGNEGKPCGVHSG